MAGRGHGEGRICITVPPDRVLPPLVASENWEGVNRVEKLGSELTTLDSKPWACGVGIWPGSPVSAALGD